MDLTMQHIADMLKISKSTVSRALSGDRRVKPETRDKVLRLARELNYHPNPLASGLARRKSNIIGVITPFAPRSLSDPFYLEFVGGIGDYAMTRGYSLLLSPTYGRSAGQDAGSTHVEMTEVHRVDGLILTEPRVDDERIEYLKANGVPFVFLGMPPRGEDIPWVDGDNVGGVRLAIDHLVSLGHSRIAFIAGPPDQTAAARRLSGYKKSLAANGIECDERLIFPGDFTEAGGYEAGRLIAGVFRERGITAVFASNDVTAIGAIRALKEAGLRVPEDVAVVGFDGIHLGHYIDPPLTTVRQPIYEMGRAACRLLIDMADKEPAGEMHVVFPLELVVGKSCGAHLAAQRYG